MNTYLNLVFHCLSDNPSGDWTLTIEKYFSIINGIDKLLELKRVRFNKYRIYFDDGERSFFDMLYSKIKKNLSLITLGISTDFLGKPRYLKTEELIRLRRQGVNIVSHGVNHSALAIYNKEDKFLLKTPAGGDYVSSSPGKNLCLKEEQVKFQYIESYRKLVSLAGNVDEFIFPYGLYNEQSVEINRKLGLYRYLSTSDAALDNGQVLRPRYLIYNSKSVEEILKEITSLI